MKNYLKTVVGIVKRLTVTIFAVVMCTAASASDIVWTNVFTESNESFSQWNVGGFSDRISIVDGRFRLTSPSNAANTNISTIEKFDGKDYENDAVSLKLTVDSFYFKPGWNFTTAYGRIGLGTSFSIDLYAYQRTGNLWFNGISYSLNSDLLDAAGGEKTTRIGVSGLEMFYYATTQQVVVRVAGSEIFSQIMEAPLSLGIGTALSISYNAQYNGGLVDYGRVGEITLDYGITPVPEPAVLSLLLGGMSILVVCAMKHRRRRLGHVDKI